VTGPKLNEAPVRRRSGLRAEAAEPGERQGTRAVARYVRVSPYKVREVLDVVRGQDAVRAREILQFSERDAAFLVAKVLGSAVANAEHNDAIGEDELYVSACFADEGPTLKRWRPRARGRATRIRKRTCHITVIVSRLPDEELTRRRTAEAGSRRARRAGQEAAEDRRRFGRRTRRGQEAPAAADEALAEEPEDQQVEAAAEVAEAGAAEVAETASAETTETAVTGEQVIAEQDTAGATQEETAAPADVAGTPAEAAPSEDGPSDDDSDESET
jgi:large subunit ribosomal protein L22